MVELVAVLMAMIIIIAFGYLPARVAARKGYNLWLFWLFGTLLLFPAALTAWLLSAKTPEQDAYE